MKALGALAGPTVAEAMRRPYDSFAVLRLSLAVAVVVSHAFSIPTGLHLDEPLTRLTGFTLGEHAVNGFFAISGFLVAMSLMRRGPLDYVIARAMRIAPGLIAAVLAVAFLLGPALTAMSIADYFADPGLWRFVTATLTTLKSTAPLPGLFEMNPYRFSMGTVWTLKYEVICYTVLLVAGIAGLLARPRSALAVVAALLAAVLIVDLLLPEATKGTQTTVRLGFLFAAGSALYVWRDRARLSLPLLAAMVAATVLLSGTPAYRAVLFATEAYAVIVLALAPGLAHPRLDFKTDLSYGVYLYGWPLQQALFALTGASAWVLLGPSLVVTVAVAYLSWRLVEKPALALKGIILERRRSATMPVAAPVSTPGE